MNNSMDSQRSIQDNTVVTLNYVLKVDGGIVDQSGDNEPIQFIQGYGHIIPGLERQLYGMTVGESKTVVVEPAEGYGEADSNAYAEVPRTEFPPDIPMETGVALRLRDNQGQVLDAYIVEIRDESVLLNFNHPLAGKELHFSVTVVDLRDATAEEINHGHVHDSEMGEEDMDDWEPSENGHELE